MLTFEMSILILVICGILAIIFLTNAIIQAKVEKAKKSTIFTAIAALINAVIVIVSYVNISIPVPVILPLDNETKIYTDKVEVTIKSDKTLFLETYYTLNGDDPKESGNIYRDTITLSDSTTVCARCKFLWRWSDIVKTPYTVESSGLSPEKKDLFISDYRPGKENVTCDNIYQNNMGFFSKQDQMYYFATSTGIYKMDSSFEKCQLIIDDKNASNLNVLGDWMYYLSSNGIYKIRTDGKYKTQIVKSEEYFFNMAIQNKSIYYIKSSDTKLYSSDLNGKNEKCLYDKPVCKFICADTYIYFVEAEIIKNDDKLSYRTTSLGRMFYDGSDIKTVFKNVYGDDGELINDTPNDLCIYEDYIVCSNYFGLFLINRFSDEITEVNHIGGYGLCVFDNYAYYSTVEPGVNGFLTKVSLDTYKTETFAKPLDDESVQLLCIYPVEDKVILMVDCEKWYYLDNNNKLIRIMFNVI